MSPARNQGARLLTKVCRILGYSRQAFYQATRRWQAEVAEEEAIIEAVCDIRKSQPYVGTRKLQRMLAWRCLDTGRDRLFDILGKSGLLVRRRRNYRKTTNSNHWFEKYPNLIRELEIVRPNQVFVSDITYIRTEQGFSYLSLITDLYSRKIVGWELSPDLTAEGPQKALDRALSQVSQPGQLIHHSDRGIQYCSSGYVKRLKSENIRISMTEDKHVYENAVAERVNGILKMELGLGRILRADKAPRAVAESIRIYNNERLHLSLDYRTPAQIYPTTA